MGIKDRIGRIVREQFSGPPNAPTPETRDLYVALATLSSRHDYGSSSLAAAELRVFSQNGEDGVIAEIFARIGTVNRHFVEFGAEDGREGNAVLLAQALGWGGLLIEADPQRHLRLQRLYANNPNVVTTRSLVTPDNINSLCRDVPEDVDLFSVDVDGQDFYIWEALTQLRPRVVVIEYNSSLPADEPLVEPRGKEHGTNDSDAFGCSIGALTALGRAKGYTFVHAEMAGVNAFFVRDDCAGPFRDASPPTFRSPNYWLLGRGHRHEEASFIVVDPK